MKKQLQKFRSLNQGRLILLAMMIVIGQGVGFSQGIKTVTSNADNGAGSLRQTIAEAVDGDVITFDGAITTITVDSTLNLGNKTLTIDGGGDVILNRELVALDSFRLVTVTGTPDKEVTIKNLTIQNGFSKQHGGGLSAINTTGGKTILENLIFKNNTANNNGGGAYTVGLAAYGNIVSNCEFIENKALHITLGRGGALFPKNVTITGSTFTDNECGDSGGAIFMDNDVAVYDSHFKGNDALDDAGGAIRMQGNNGIASNCTFESNSANSSGGAIFMAKGFVSNSEFINNSCVGNGGAIYTNTDLPQIHNSLFRGNSTAGVGGAVYMDDGSLISNCILTNNTSAVNGGGVYMKGAAGTGKLVGSVIAYNKADSIGGGVYAGTANVINSIITKNYAAENGGALSGDGNWSLANSIVFDNDAAGADKNIQVVANSAAIAATNSAIDATAYNAAAWTATGITTLNASPFVGGSGADSLMLPSGSALIDAGDITGITALIPETDLNGLKRVMNGAIDLGAYERYISFVVTTDADNSAGSLRQAIADAVDGESLITFADGIATVKVGAPLQLGDKTVIIDGGGDVVLDGAFNGDPALDIYRVFNITGVLHKNVTIKNLTIQNGVAASNGDGGGLSADHTAGGQSILDNLVFKNNKADDMGGAVSITGYNADTVCMITNTEFVGNSAVDDGGAVVAKNTMFSECTFTDNVSGDAGGAARADAEALFDNCTFKGNSAAGAGGAIRLSDVTATASNCMFDSNIAAGSSGAVFMARGSVLNSEFVNNKANGGDGGAIFANQNECIIDNSLFRGNSSSASGGAVFVDDGGVISNCIFDNNSAVVNGGGVFLKGDLAPGLLVGSVIVNNTANGKGGGLYVLEANVINSIITNNYAGTNGGAFTGEIGPWFIANSVVWDNDATGADKNIEFISNSATDHAANSAIDATAYNSAAWTATNIKTLSVSPFVGGSGVDSLYSASLALVDAGTLDYGIADILPELDLKGENRIQGTLDLGAYETEIIRVLSVALDRSSIEVSAGVTSTLVATVEPGFATDKSVTWSSSDESVATVNGGVVTGVASGSATITVTTVDGSFTATSSVTVRIAVSGVTLDQTAVALEVNETVTLVATLAPANATDQTVGWVSGNEDVATVNGGLVTAISAGTATISVISLDGSFIANCEVTVTEASIGVTGVSLDQVTLALEPGGTGTLVATVAPADGTDKSVSWASSDAAVATVANGVVTAVADGTCTITVTTTDGGFTATCNVIVESVGIEQFRARFEIYPNPVQNNLFIKGENIHSVSIYSVTGTPVMVVKKGVSEGINVAGIEPGMYFLKITTDNGTAVTRIVKK